MTENYDGVEKQNLHFVDAKCTGQDPDISYYHERVFPHISIFLVAEKSPFRFR